MVQPDLHALAALAARVVPGLDGRVVPAAEAGPPWHAGHDTRQAFDLLRRRHPEAGPHYAALRGWGLAVWQPVYLAVIAVHLHGLRPDLDQMSLVSMSSVVEGYRLGEHEAFADGGEEALHAAAAQLRRGIDALLAVWQRHAPLATKAAMRTSADCALAAVLAVRRHRQDGPLDAARAHGMRWLEALGLRGESGFFAYRTPCGREALALERKVCCLHFRRAGEEPCDTCPKRRLQERIARLNGQASAVENMA